MRSKSWFRMAVLHLLLLFFQTVFSQKIMSGKVLVDGVPTEKVNVLNSKTGFVTSTNAEGRFSIAASADDILVFSAVNLETKRLTLQESDFLEELLTIKMAAAIIPLDEININQENKISAEDLGIIPRGQKKYTPAERRLREATSGGGLVPLNPILNAMSGRTTMLKKEVAVEQKEKLLLRLDGWFQDKFYLEQLKIPLGYIRGFHYFLIEDDDFVRALKSKNRTLTRFLMIKSAPDYKKTIQ